MKKVIAIALTGIMLFVGCTQNAPKNPQVIEKEQVIPTEVVKNDLEVLGVEETISEEKEELSFTSLQDGALHRYVEDTLYNDLVAQLDSDTYFVENITTNYISQEYIEELVYNTTANVYFGYTLDEVNQVFQDEAYVFTVNEIGETVIEPFKAYESIYPQVLKNVAFGSGVILICVTVSMVTAGTGTSAVSMIFATSAKSATTFAVSSAGLSGVVEGVMTGVETGDMDEALKEVTLAASEGFKWGALTGALTGGVAEAGNQVNLLRTLKGTDLKGLTPQQAAKIQNESGYPIDVIKQFHTMDEYEVLKQAGLKNQVINGKNALISKDIDLHRIDEFGRTNLQRMQNGLSPLDEYGKSYQLHHIGQEADATLAVLSEEVHQKNTKILHGFKDSSVIDRPEFAKERKSFWESLGEMLGGIV